MASRGSTSEYKGIYSNGGNWGSQIWVSPSSRECANRDICLIWPLACLWQFGRKVNLGTYELQEDAARAFDKVARILGRSDLNFPKSAVLEINGPRSKGADEAVAVTVTAANASMLGSSLVFY